jgi:RNA polymerase sigma-70 factor (ECF subfamily)
MLRGGIHLATRSATTMRPPDPSQPGTRSRDGAIDDVHLMGLVAIEDVAAFETLYRAYYPRLARFLRGMLRQSASLVDEVLDDTMLVAWRKAHTWDATSQLSTWLFAIAYRQALKALRRSDLAMAATDDPPIPAEAEPDGELQHEQLRAHLRAALGTLSMEHRAVMELTYYQGYSCREIAEIMACPVATVKTRMFYARQKLRTLLGQRGEQAL